MSSKTLVNVLEQARIGSKGITFIGYLGKERFLSYKALYEKATYTLYNLQKMGLGPGDELVFQINDNEKFLQVFWGCLLGKIIPIPLSDGKKPDHKSKVINVWKSLNRPYLICNVAEIDHLGDYARENQNGSVFDNIADRLIDLNDALKESKAGRLEKVLPEDIAYIQYSSGSTGEPKGVVLTHRNLVVNTTDIFSRSQMSASDSMLSWMPLTHDMGLICFHLTGVLAAVHQYLIPATLFIKRPLLWFEKVSKHKVTQLYSPNFGYQYFLSALKPLHVYQWDLSSVRLIYNGAEPISKSLCEDFMKTMGEYGLCRTAMFPGYGLAEASVAVSLPNVGDELTFLALNRKKLNIGDLVEEWDDLTQRPIYFAEVGYPIANCQVRIVHDNMVLSENRIGHVQIKGANVTKCYYTNEEATQKVFTKDGWLNTGDLGFFRNGRLVITGRSKNLIIINGQNYYPQDIEQFALEVEGVKPGGVAICCIPEADDLLYQKLVLFVLFKKSMEEFLPLALQLKEKIFNAIGLIIDQVVAVKKIPKTTSGKVQNFKLVENYEDGFYKQDSARLEYLEKMYNQNPNFHKLSLTEKLQVIYRELFGKRVLSNNEDFFTAGVNSLMATRLASRIHQLLGIELTIRDIFENPTVVSLSEYLAGKSARKFAPIPVKPQAAHYQLSFGQKRLWSISKFGEKTPACNLFFGFLIKGRSQVDKLALNPEILGRVLQSLVARHESLRTVFVEVEGEPRQKILSVEESGFELDYKDLRADPRAIDRVKQIAQREAETPFDLSTGPLLRAKLLQVDTEGYYLLLTVHHIIVDGWSMELLSNEIHILYRSYVSGEAVLLPPLRIQYKDYTYWQEQQLSGERLKGHRQYWMDQLSGELPVLELPTDYPRPSLPSLRGKTLEFT
ncbi:AMP-binding protein, partial [Fulvivirgaceae bacterium BMA12]|nr:AMP-binding protein [Fulvivirgaceae bacterium BMA12]